MRTYSSDANGPATAIRIWANAGVVNEAFYTIPNDHFNDAAEVPMTLGSNHGIIEVPPIHRILWTKLATGGCTPFAVFVRQSGTDDTLAFALAHLCFEPEKEAMSFGTELKAFNRTPENVYLAVIKDPGKTIQSEPKIYFKNFQIGFGADISRDNKVLIKSQPLGTAAITRDGFFGELSQAQVQALTPGHRARVQPNGRLKMSCCVLF